MSSLNKCQFIGRLGSDPETAFLPSGGQVCNLSIAVSEKWKDKNTGQPQEKTEWVRVAAFQRLAEIMGEYLKKGSLVYIEGKMVTRKWQDKSGQDKYSTEINANNMIMLDTKNSNAQNNQNQNQQAPQNQGHQVQQQSVNQGGQNNGQWGDDPVDIPF